MPNPSYIPITIRCFAMRVIMYPLQGLSYFTRWHQGAPPYSCRRQQNDDSCATLKGPIEASLRPNRRIPDVSEGNTMKNRDLQATWAYHNGTKHSNESIRTNRHYLD